DLLLYVVLRDAIAALPAVLLRIGDAEPPPVVNLLVERSGLGPLATPLRRASFRIHLSGVGIDVFLDELLNFAPERLLLWCVCEIHGCLRLCQTQMRCKVFNRFPSASCSR